MTRLTTDIDRAVYDRQRAASREDRVLHVAFLPSDALNARERRIAAAIARQSAMAAETVRRERAAARRRMWLALDTLKEPQP